MTTHTMLHCASKLRSIAWIGFFLLMSLLCSCTNEKGDLGKDLIGGSESDFFSFDTLTLRTTHYEVDSVNVSATGGTGLIIGFLENATFGPVEAVAYNQIYLTKNNISFPEASTLDSIFLELDISQGNGNLSGPLTIQVREVAESLEIDEETTSDVSFALGDILADYTFTPEWEDGQQSIQVPLNAVFWDMLQAADSASYATNTDFLELFPGLSFSLQSSDPSGALVRVAQSTGRMRIFFNATDSLDFTFDSDAAYHTYFERDYENTSVQAALDAVDQTEFIYVEGMSGVEAGISIPFAAQLPDDLPIHRASLILTPEIQDTALFSLPSFLFLNAYDAELGTYSALADGSLIGGFYDDETNQYIFNITLDLLTRVRETSTTELRLRLNPATSVERLRLYGVNASINAPKLIVYYSE